MPFNILIKADSQIRTGGNHMDKTGLVALIIGLILCALGGYAIWIFLPEVFLAVKGLIGIAVLLVGIMLVIFGLVLCALGGYAIWIFLPEVFLAVKGLIGIAVLLVGIMLVIFGALIFRD
jgi:hypothetical protein